MPEELHFTFVDLEFLFDSNDEGTQISEIVANLVQDFGTKIIESEVVLDSNDPDSEFEEGGVALYRIFPNKEGLVDALQTKLGDFDVEIKVEPTKG
jgi:hypothetical protein